MRYLLKRSLANINILVKIKRIRISIKKLHICEKWASGQNNFLHEVLVVVVTLPSACSIFWSWWRHLDCMMWRAVTFEKRQYSSCWGSWMAQWAKTRKKVHFGRTPHCLPQDVDFSIRCNCVWVLWTFFRVLAHCGWDRESPNDIYLYTRYY